MNITSQSGSVAISVDPVNEYVNDELSPAIVIVCGPVFEQKALACQH